jgi:hypothetical protein
LLLDEISFDMGVMQARLSEAGLNFVAWHAYAKGVSDVTCGCGFTHFSSMSLNKMMTLLLQF